MTESDRGGRRPRSSRRWLTVRDIAALLHVSESTVRRWIRKEKLTANFFGGRIGYRIRRADLQEFLRRSPRLSKQRTGGIPVATS